jgi:hypothetical protein
MEAFLTMASLLLFVYAQSGMPGLGTLSTITETVFPMVNHPNHQNQHGLRRPQDGAVESSPPESSQSSRPVSIQNQETSGTENHIEIHHHNYHIIDENAHPRLSDGGEPPSQAEDEI